MKQHRIGEENKEVTYSLTVRFNIAVFRDVMPRTFLDAGQGFGEIRRLHFQSISATCSQGQRVPP